MKFTSKSLVKTILSLSLVICIVLSMSSCYFQFSFSDLLEGGESEEDSGGGNKSDGTTTKPDGSPDFYPNSGTESIENVSAKNRTLLSTVSIVCTFGYTPSAGSGVIYSIDKEKGDAYIITNYHVLYYGGLFDKCEVYLYGMENSQYAIPATFVGGSLTNDIAIIKVSASQVLKNSYAIAAPFANSEKVHVFDTSIVVGNAEGFGISATYGIVSVESESLEIEGADGSMIKLRVMRTDAAVNLGSSGGGLYNADGEIIGIIVAKRTGDDVDNFGYAIPANLAKNLADNIIDLCNGSTSTKPQRPVIGITVAATAQGIKVDPESGEISQAHVSSITKITDNCKIADKIAVGDVINSLTVNGKKTVVDKYYQVTETMYSARVGDTVVLNLTRGSETFDVTFTVTSDMISHIS